MAKYRLLKDCLGVKAGTICETNGDGFAELKADDGCIVATLSTKADWFGEYFEEVGDGCKRWRADRGGDYYCVDIDGTLAHMHDRSPYDWSKVGNDMVDIPIAWLTSILFRSVSVILVSGRDASCHKETQDWLAKNSICYTKLIMRKEGDNRPDEVVKEEIFNEHIRGNYNVRFVLDDRNKVVDMWRQLGLKCLQVAEGDF